MATPAAILAIEVKANTAAARAGLAKTQAQLREADAASGTLTKSSGRTGAALRKVGTAAKWAGAAIGVAFVYETKKAVTTTQDLTKSTISLHKNLGLSNKQASEWAGLAKARGVDSTKLGMAFKTLATQITEARAGSASAVKEFKRLGFSQQDIQRASHDTQFAIKAVADGLNNLKGGADKTAIAGKLFGRGWQTVAPIFRDGSKAVQEQLNTVEKYGGVIRGKTLKDQTRLLKNTRENKLAWQGLQIQLAEFVTPVLNRVSDQFQKIAKIQADPRLTPTEKWKKISRILDRDFRKALNFIVKLIPEVASRVGEAAPKIAGALVQGFLNANVWGKLLLTAWFIKRLGGWGLIEAIGSRFGTRMGGAMATSTVATTVGPQGIPQKIKGKAGRFSGIGRLMGGFIAGGLTTALFIGIQGAFTSKGGILDTLKGKPIDLSIHSELLNKALDQLKAHFGSLNKAAKHMSAVQKEQFFALARNAHDAGQISDKAFDKLQRTFGDTEQSARRHMGAAGDATRKMADTIGNQTGNARDRADQHTQQMANKVGANADQMKRQMVAKSHKMAVATANNLGDLANAITQGLDVIGGNVNRSLKAFGVKALKFTLKHPGKLGRTIGSVAGALGFQRGGLIPGAGDGDKVPVMAEPGEGFINKRAVKALGGPAAIEAINAMVPRFAYGGVVPAVAQVIRLMTKQFPGLAVTSTTGGSHVPGSYHPQGKAVDLANPNYGYMDRAAAWVKTSGLYRSLLEGIHNPNLSVSQGKIVPPSFYASVWAAHRNHIHLALDHLGKIAGAGVRQIARVLLKGPDGPLKDLGQAALDRVRKAANDYISRHAALGGDMVPGRVPKGMLSKAQLASLWRRTGSGGNANLMAAIAMAESGGNPRADNGIARGLWQIIQSTWAAYGKGSWDNAFDPVMNAQAAHRILAGSGLGAWETYTNGAYRQFLQRGGMVQRLAKGGKPEVTREDITAGLGNLSVANLIRLSRESGAHPGIRNAALRAILDRVHKAEKDVPIRPFGRLHDLTERLKVLELTRQLHPKSKDAERKLNTFLKSHAVEIVRDLTYRGREWKRLRLQKQIAEHTPGTEDDERIKKMIAKFLGKKPKAPGAGDQFARTQQFFEFLKLLGPTTPLSTFARGGTLGAGRVGIAGERGPELVTGPARIHSATETASILRPNFDLRIWIGDREITDIVRVELKQRDRAEARRHRMGPAVSR